MTSRSIRVSVIVIVTAPIAAIVVVVVVVVVIVIVFCRLPYRKGLVKPLSLVKRVSGFNQNGYHRHVCNVGVGGGTGHHGQSFDASEIGKHCLSFRSIVVDFTSSERFA
ncbi:hypothetical protein M0804_004684 [Polistes exclamans]|nr:hypothetical protein M0804_004684 [Polistes exclamans]